MRRDVLPIGRRSSMRETMFDSGSVPAFGNPSGAASRESAGSTAIGDLGRLVAPWPRCRWTSGLEPGVNGFESAVSCPGADFGSGAEANVRTYRRRARQATGRSSERLPPPHIRRRSGFGKRAHAFYRVRCPGCEQPFVPQPAESADCRPSVPEGRRAQTRHPRHDAPLERRDPGNPGALSRDEAGLGSSRVGDEPSAVLVLL